MLELPASGPDPAYNGARGRLALPGDARGFILIASQHGNGHTVNRPAPAVVALRACALLALFALIAVVAARRLGHDDLFFHLRTGFLIARTGEVPHVDSFSYTLPGAPWTTHEWGFAVLVASVFSVFGYHGLVWLTAVLAVALFGLIALLMARLSTPARSYLWAPLLLLGMLGVARPGFILRAALLSSLGFAALQLLLHLHHARPRWSTRAALAALFVLWSNVHVGVVIASAILGCYWLQVSFERARSAADRSVRSLLRAAAGEHLALTVGCMLLTLLNANGFKLWTFPFELDAIYYRSGVTWVLHMFERPTPGDQPFFFVGLALVLAACVPLQRLRALLLCARHPLLFQGLCTLFFAVMALRSTRFIPELFIFALPLLAARWGGVLDADVQRSPAESRALLWHGAALASVVAVATIMQPQPAREPIAPFFPKRAVDFMEREHIRGRVFHGENWGGYLGFRLQMPVYWDGRNDVFWPLSREYAWNRDAGQLVARHQLNLLLLDKIRYDKFKLYLTAHRQDWALLYFDDQAAIYATRGATVPAAVLANAYQLFLPFGTPSLDALAIAVRNPRLAPRLAADLATMRRQGSNEYLVLFAQAASARARGDLKQAQHDILLAYALHPTAEVERAAQQIAAEVASKAQAEGAARGPDSR